MAAGPVGLNFVSGSSENLGAAEQAGAPGYAQSHWNNGGSSGSGVAVVDNSGAATGLTVSWHANNTWGNNAGTDTPDGKLMHGYLDSTGDPNNDSSPYQFSANANSPDIYVQGLNAWLSAQGAVACDVVVYFNGDTSGRIAEYWVQQGNGTDANGGPTALGADLSSHVFGLSIAGFDGTYTQVPLRAVDDSSAASGNYIVFPGVASDSFLIRSAEHSMRSVINGFQLVPRSTMEAPTIVLNPQSQTKYVGGQATFSVGACGTKLRYQWTKNGSNLLNATNACLTVSGLTLADNASQYGVVVSNDSNQATATAATLTVLSVPAANGFAGTVLANNPIDYWRFNDSGIVNADYVGSRNGVSGVSTYSDNGALGLSQDGSFLGFESGNTAWMFSGPSAPGSSVCIQGGLGVITNAMTFVAWVYPMGYSGQQASWAGLMLTAGGNKGGSGLTYTDNKNELGYQWDNYWAFRSGLVVPDSQWSMVAMVVEPTQVTLYVANPTTGLLSAVDSSHANDLCVFNNDFWIGTDPTFSTSRGFAGAMDEVAIFTQSLSRSQILSLYSAGLLGGSAPPVIAQQPVSQQLYAGRTAKFSVNASAVGTMTYQWKTASGNVVDGGRISGAQTSTLTISNVVAADAGAFWVDVKNPVGTTPSATVTLAIVSPSGAAYEAAVLADQPYAYWRFSETSGTNAFDNVGGFTGTYGATAILGTAGPASPAFVGFEASNTALQPTRNVPGSYMTVSGLNLNTNTATFTGWIYSYGGQDASAGLLFCRAGDTGSGLCYRDSTLSYTWNGNWDWHSSLVIPDNQWVFVALVVEPDKGTVYMGTNGVLNSSIRVMSHATQSFSGLTSIGADTFSDARIFNGLIDEVSIFKRSLSGQEIAQLYSQATGQGVPPTVTMLGATNLMGWPGVSGSFTATVFGSGQLAYQWYKGSTALVDGGNVWGASTPSLTITNATVGNVGDYTLVVSGVAGMATGAVCSVTIGVPPSHPYHQTVLAANPVAYWRLNETNGTIAYDSAGSFNGTYGAAVKLSAPGQPNQGLFGFGTDTTSAQFTHGTSQSWITLPALNLNSSTVTITTWVYPTARPDNWSGIFISGGASRAGLTFRDNNPDNTLGMMWNNGDFWYDGTSLGVPVGQWSLLALSVAPTSATLYVLNNSGTNSWVNSTTMNAEPFSGNTLLGCDNSDTSRIFNGYMNNVAVFNRTLSGDEIGQLYSAGVTEQTAPLPVITLQIQRNGNNVELTWPRGTLYEADDVNGTWTVVPNAVAPSYSIPATETKKFFRVISDN